jgi:hypothetical protein
MEKGNGGRMRGSNVGARIEQVRILRLQQLDSSLEQARARALLPLAAQFQRAHRLPLSSLSALQTSCRMMDQG